ncbi:hypothetical protein SDC9_107250 [bioreactor metagenome]|uniref:Uncharacterized protein n=1 Tax=bioreactor metagenome TaxID=1076179 RepID=A0A645B4N1_9ZZZZ
MHAIQSIIHAHISLAGNFSCIVAEGHFKGFHPLKILNQNGHCKRLGRQADGVVADNGREGKPLNMSYGNRAFSAATIFINYFVIIIPRSKTYKVSVVLWYAVFKDVG